MIPAVAIDNANPPLDVMHALAEARQMRIHSVWCRGLWVWNKHRQAWRPVEPVAAAARR